ncbi:MAG TPA: hypothetical protein VHS03_10935, partial [Gaiellaceae bacterium]|nr:hypothetical protein [Gaiellaceae bacterium]
MEDTLGVALVESERVPALTVAVAVTLAAEAAVVAASATPTTAAAMQALRAEERKMLLLGLGGEPRVSSDVYRFVGRTELRASCSLSVKGGTCHP